MRPDEPDTGSRRLRIVLPPDLSAPARARSALRRLPLGERADDVLLLASELVANAVGHAELAPGEPIELSADCAEGRTRVEVRDRGRGFAHSEPSDGYGLRVLAAASERWGIEHDGDTRVWFELDGTRPAAPLRADPCT